MNSLESLKWQGETGPWLHVAAANGFPPHVYKGMLNKLKQPYRLCSAPFAPLQTGRDPKQIHDWRQLADELRHSLRDAGAEQILGLGHSVGAVVSMLAAAKDPGLFRALVLIDPVIFSGLRAWTWGWMQRLNQTHRLPLVSRAARRRAHWNSHQEVLQHYASKAFFSAWDKGVLEDYLNAGLVTDDDKTVRLRYSPAWEARIFATAPHNVWPEISSLKIPLMLIRGGRSDAFLKGAAARFVRAQKNARCELIPEASHLVPMEQTQRCAALVDDFFTQLDRV